MKDLHSARRTVGMILQTSSRIWASSWADEFADAKVCRRWTTNSQRTQVWFGVIPMGVGFATSTLAAACPWISGQIRLISWAERESEWRKLEPIKRLKVHSYSANFEMTNDVRKVGIDSLFALDREKTGFISIVKTYAMTLLVWSDSSAWEVWHNLDEESLSTSWRPLEFGREALSKLEQEHCIAFELFHRFSSMVSVVVHAKQCPGSAVWHHNPLLLLHRDTNTPHL